MINILVITDIQVDPRTGFYAFYEQLVSYLKRKGFDSSLFVASLRAKKLEYTPSNYNSLILPQKEYFANEENICAISGYIDKNRINVVFNLLWPTNDTTLFFTQIRKQCAVRLFHLIHGRPDTVLVNKSLFIREHSIQEIKSVKMKLQKIFSSFYLCLLKKDVSRRNLRYFEIHDATVLLSSSYIDDYKNTIEKEIEREKIFAIPNPLSAYKNNVPICEKHKEILFVGRLSAEKQVEQLLFIWKKIHTDIPDWHLIIVGDGDQSSFLRDLSKQLELKQIEFTGWQNSLAYIDRASILCLASKFEGLPTVILEAMSLGTVPVSYNSFSAVYDMIESGENGFIIPYLDMEQYAEKLKYLVENDDVRIRFAENAQNYVTKFDVESVGQLWLECFQKTRVI